MAKKPARQLNIKEAELEALVRVSKSKLYKHTANIAGFYRSRTLINGGNDFVGLREYSPGDEVRSINWRASARTSQFQVHQYQQERGARWFICLDVSASMKFPKSKKWLQALYLSDALAYILISAGNQVGLITFSDKVQQFCSLGHGRQQYKKLHKIFDLLMPENKGGGSLLQVCNSHIKQQANVIVISDFLQVDFMQHGIQALYKSGHYLHIMQTVAIDEIELAGEGLINLSDSESGISFSIENSHKNKDLALHALNQHCKMLARYCQEKRIIYSLATDNRSWKDVLLEHIVKL